MRIGFARVFREHPDRLLYATALAAGSTPLTMLLANAIGLELTPLGLVLIAGLALALMLKTLLPGYMPLQGWGIVESGIGVLILLSILAAVGLKLAAVSDLEVGLWGDSLHHTIIVQLLVDHVGLFQSWQPYAPLTTFTYHYGFHANAALLHFVSGLPMPRAMVVAGQLTQVASLVTVALFTASLVSRIKAADTLRTLVAGLAAFAMAGFINIMPSYFVNWGRFTQLAGHVLLPAVILAWHDQIIASSLNWRGMLLAALLTAMLVVTHYLVTLFAVVAIASILILHIVRQTQRRVVLSMARNLAIGLVATVLLCMPWLGNTLASSITGLLTAPISQAAPSSAANVATNVLEGMRLLPILPFYIKPGIALLAAAGWLIAFRSGNSLVMQIPVWMIAMVFMVTPTTFGLPGAGIIDYLTAYIALYVFAAPLAGLGVAAIFASIVGLMRHKRWFALPIAAGATTVAFALGVPWQLQILDRNNFMLYTPQDARALLWIRENTPSHARFLINGFPAYGGTLVAGNDAGWWLQYLTGRETNLPPLTYGVERGATPEYLRDVNQAWATLRGAPLRFQEPVAVNLTTPEALLQLQRMRITHIYAGKQQRPASTDRIDTRMLRDNPRFRVVYEDGGVEVFEIMP